MYPNGTPVLRMWFGGLVLALLEQSLTELPSRCSDGDSAPGECPRVNERRCVGPPTDCGFTPLTSFQ